MAPPGYDYYNWTLQVNILKNNIIGSDSLYDNFGILDSNIEKITRILNRWNIQSLGDYYLVFERQVSRNQIHELEMDTMPGLSLEWNYDNYATTSKANNDISSTEFSR